jgi:hypothetical protein
LIKWRLETDYVCHISLGIKRDDRTHVAVPLNRGAVEMRSVCKVLHKSEFGCLKPSKLYKQFDSLGLCCILVRLRLAIPNTHFNHDTLQLITTEATIAPMWS